MAYAFQRQNKGTPSFTGVYEGPDGTRRSAGSFPRAGLRSAPVSVKSRRSGKGGGGIVPSVTSRLRPMSRTAGSPANISRPRLALHTGRISTGTFCRSSAAGRC
jgi:hypothetical protein